LNFDQVLEIEAAKARKDLEASSKIENPYHSQVTSPSGRLNLKLSHKFLIVSKDPNIKSPGMIEKMMNALSFTDDASKRNFR
jgi:hypothetical protein